jgi:hypothetical protein
LTTGNHQANQFLLEIKQHTLTRLFLLLGACRNSFFHFFLPFLAKTFKNSPDLARPDCLHGLFFAPDLVKAKNLAALADHRHQSFYVCQIFRQIWQ